MRSVKVLIIFSLTALVIASLLLVIFSPIGGYSGRSNVVIIGIIFIAVLGSIFLTVVFSSKNDNLGDSIKTVLVTVALYLLMICFLSTAYLLTTSKDKKIFRCDLMNQCPSESMPPLEKMTYQFGPPTFEPQRIQGLPLYMKIIAIVVSPIIVARELIDH